jgi:hypothetical protein
MGKFSFLTTPDMKFTCLTINESISLHLEEWEAVMDGYQVPRELQWMTSASSMFQIQEMTELRYSPVMGNLLGKLAAEC